MKNKILIKIKNIIWNNKNIYIICIIKVYIKINKYNI